MVRGYLACPFDLLNVGDLDVIRQARAQCDQLVVGVHSDEYVEQLCGRRPVVPAAERMELLRHVRGVDTVVLHDAAGSLPAAGDWTVFAVAGLPVPVGAAVVAVVPARMTRSAVLRETLQPLSASGAA